MAASTMATHAQILRMAEQNRLKGFLGTANEMTAVAEVMAPKTVEWVRSLTDAEIIPMGVKALGDIADDILVLDEIRQRFRKGRAIEGYANWTEFVEKNSKYSIRTIQYRLNEVNNKDETKVNDRFKVGPNIVKHLAAISPRGKLHAWCGAGGSERAAIASNEDATCLYCTSGAAKRQQARPRELEFDAAYPLPDPLPEFATGQIVYPDLYTKDLAQAAPAVEDDPELEQPTAPVKNPNYNKAGTRGYDLDKPNLNTFLRRLTAIAAFGAAPFPDVANDALYECGDRVESANAVVNHIDAATKRLNEYRAQFEAKMPPEQLAEPAELEITEDEARVIFANKNGEVLSDKTPNGNRNYHYITFERNGRFWRFNVDCQRGSKPRIMSADRTKNGSLCEEVFPVGVTEYRTREELAESGEVVAAPAPTAEPAIVELKEGTLVRFGDEVYRLDKMSDEDGDSYDTVVSLYLDKIKGSKWDDAPVAATKTRTSKKGA